MKITCSKCKKVYTVDSSKIPPGVTGTRCKACGNSIPLRPGAPDPTPPEAPQAPPPPPKSDALQISCQYCSQQYQINPTAIPQGVTSTRCKSCGHAISLKPAAAAVPPSPEPAQSGVQNSETVKIACLYCGKQYSIDTGKIPPGVTTLKCKACSRPISLKAAQTEILADKGTSDKKVAQIQPPKAQQSTPAAADVPPVRDTGRPVNPVWRSRGALVAVAGIILLLLAGYFVGTHWPQLSESRFGLDKIIAKKSAALKRKPAVGKGTAAGSTATADPFFALRLNVPLLLQAIDQNLPDDQKDIRFQMAKGIFGSFGLANVQLYLYPDSEHAFLPVILADSQDGNRLEKQLTSQGNYGQLLEALPDGSYRIKKEAIPEDKQNSFPIDQYRIQFIDNMAVFAPQILSGLLADGLDPIGETRVAQMMAAIAQPRDLAALSIQIPENFNTDWQKKIQNNPAVQQNPQAAMMIAMGGGILGQLSEPLKGVESLAIGFRLDQANGRVLNYAQQFRKGVKGKRIYRQLKKGNPDDLEVDGMVLKLIELFKDPRYQHKIGFKNNRLTIELNWEQAHDNTLLTALSEATIGQLFAQGMELTPSEGPVAAQYTARPLIAATVNIDSLKKTIPQAVRQNLFPGNYWSFGDEPRMTLDFDTLAIPNASLARMQYEVIEVASTDGADIMRVAENAFQHILNPGSASPGYIEVNVKKDTPAEALGTAKIRFNVALPARLKIVEFDAGDTPGKVRKSEGVSVKLGRLEKDVAKVSYRGGVSAQVFAFDSTGRSLASKESMSAASSAASRFQGIINRLQVVVVEEILEHPFEVTVDLNRGKELVLSHKPENPARWRYDHRPMQTYVSYTADELNGLDVTWREAGSMTWTDSLHVSLPRGPFSGDIRWEVHFSSERDPVYLSGNSFHSPAAFSYGLSNGELKKANAAFGKVWMKLAAAIGRFTFEKQTDSQISVQKLPSGQPLKVGFNQNEITLDAGKANVIQMMAFDAEGQPLKKDGYTGIQGNQKKLYFWGLPARLVIDVATQEIEKTMNFDVRQRPVDEARYAKFKQDIANHRDIVDTLRKIARGRRKDRARYGDDIAGLYYLYDRNKQKPLALIDQQVAHSDPAGQERFGYRLKPYKGYYFTVLSGIESGNLKNDYRRMPQPKKFNWQKGAFQSKPFLQPPDLVAIPKDGSQPTFFIQFDQIYMKQLNGNKLTYLPEDYYNKGWVEAKFVGG